MLLPPLFIFPLLSGLLLPAAFLLSYLIAVYLGHTHWGWPYISDTTTSPPESCIFSQLVNIGVLFVTATIYIRYKQVAEYCSSYQLPSRLSILNAFCLASGWGGAVGLSFFANFEETEVPTVHFVGFYLCFLLGLVWAWCTVLATYTLHPMAAPWWLVLLRLGLAITYSLTFLTMWITGGVAWSRYDGQFPVVWSPEVGGWTMHCFSTASEWLMALSLDLTILSLVPEFRNLTLDSPQIRLIVNRSSSVLDIREDDLDGYSSSGSLVA